MHNLLNGSDYSGLEPLQPLVVIQRPNPRRGQELKHREFNAGHELRACLPEMFPDLWHPEHFLIFDEYDETYNSFCATGPGQMTGVNALTLYADRMSDVWEDRLETTGLSDAVLASGSAHVMVHILRLIVAHTYAEAASKTKLHEQTLIWLTLFADHHLLSVRFLNMIDFSSKAVADIDFDISSSPDWLRVDPVHIRAPWWGSLPDLSSQIIAYAGFTRPRMPSVGTMETQFTSAFVTKQIPKACAVRNIAEILAKMLQQNPLSFALALDITLIVLLGNYPGAGERMPFALRSHLASAFLSVMASSPIDQCVWIQMYHRLVYFCFKTYVEMLYLRNPTLRTMLFTDYSYATHSQIVNETLSKVRAILRQMPVDDLRGGNFEALVSAVVGGEPASEAAAAMEFVGKQVRGTWEKAESLCWSLHVVTTACYQKLTAGSFAVVLGSAMHRLVNTVDSIMAVPGLFESSCTEINELLRLRVRRSNWTAQLNHFMSIFPALTPPPPGFHRLRVVNDVHPILAPGEVQAARVLAQHIVTRPPTWPYLEMLLALGVPSNFVDTLQALFLSYVAPMTDNMFRRMIAGMFTADPRSFLLVEAVYWHVVQLLQVVVFPLPEHHTRAQLEAVRRRDGTLPTMAGRGKYTSMFTYCSGCMWVFSDIAQPEEGLPGSTQSFGLRPGEGTCRYDPVRGYHVCERTKHPGCRRPVVMIDMLGVGILFRRRYEYRLCSRCARPALYHPLRDTTYGLVCHCEEYAAPAAPTALSRVDKAASAGEADFAYLCHLRAPKPYRVTKRPYCCICNTPVTMGGGGKFSGMRIMVYDNAIDSLVSNPPVRPAWTCLAHAVTVNVYCERNNMHPGNILPLRELISTHDRFVRTMNARGVMNVV